MSRRPPFADLADAAAILRGEKPLTENPVVGDRVGKWLHDIVVDATDQARARKIGCSVQWLRRMRVKTGVQR